jgi:hypothetical protein
LGAEPLIEVKMPRPAAPEVTRSSQWGRIAKLNSEFERQVLAGGLEFEAKPMVPLEPTLALANDLS